MIVREVVHYKFNTQRQMEFRADAYTYLLQHNAIQVQSPEILDFPEGKVIFFLRPGESTVIQSAHTHFLYDLLAFQPEDAQDQQLLNTLELPTGPNSSALFYVISSLIKAVCDLHYSADRYQKEKTDAHLRLLLYGTASGNEVPADSSHQELMRHKFRRLRVIVADKPSKKWTVQEAADYVGLSPSRFCVVYKEIFSSTFSADVLRSRIQHACSILTTTDLSIQQVAQILNYENDTFFYRQFKQQIGISPGEYRKLRIGAQ